ncbi:MAG TPA: FIST N-terminal domain-containing protein [Acidimicrobiales bacterium]
MPFAAALSEHPSGAHAVGEVVGTVLEAIGEEPDLAVLFVTEAHGGAIEDIAGVVRTALRPGVLLGATAVSVLGGSREVEQHPGVSLWAARLPSRPVPVRLATVDTDRGPAVVGMPEEAGRAATLLLVPDPYSFPADRLLDRLTELAPGLTVVGGLASAARGPGGNRLVLDDRVFTDGAVGALLDRSVPVAAVVSQGCRPIGQPLTVTRAERNVVYELGGRPALDRLREAVAALPADERPLAAGGIHVGRVIDERRTDFERGDFLIRAVLGADREAGAIAVGDQVEVGSTVQFQVRDAGAADEDLRALLAGRSADAALVFTCNGRGMGLFGVPDHDAGLVARHVTTAGASAGMFCAGELGPVGGRNFVHGYTASVALFSDPAGPTRPTEPTEPTEEAP